MLSHSSNPDGALLLGFGAGLFWFFKGFRVYREYRVLMDTPEVPIRSIAMGLVEIHGKARAEQVVASPVTRTPCCFYQVMIERWVTDKNGGHWAHAATDADGVKFYLEDGSGKVLVDAHHAEYDLVQTAKVATGGAFGNSLGRLVSGLGATAVATGTMASQADLSSYAQSAVGRLGSSFSLRGGSLLAFGGGINLGSGFSSRYRLTEYLVLPGHWYDLTGTCVENPSPQDEYDRNLIVKGTNEPTFLISWRSEKEIKRTLRNRAAQYIFGGAVLAVVCLGILLARHGAF
ncbi:MAG TPA: hypothetical protein VKO18_19920 [Terriglobia bacterium]|nr:hypothetical protein [Terriglobia bacterium]